MASTKVAKMNGLDCCVLQVGAIVPWNYPFHNVFNPLTAAVFAGNAIVIKVCAPKPSAACLIAMCAVLCCAVLCRAVPCHAVLCCAVLCCAV